MTMTGKFFHYFTPFREADLLQTDFLVAGVKAFRPVTGDYHFILLPGVGAFLMFVVIVEIDFPLIPLCEGPGVPGFRQGIRYASADIEYLKQSIHLLPILVN